MRTLKEELLWLESPEFVLGEHLYLGTVKTAEGQVAVVSVGYKPDYAARKLRENLQILQARAPISACYLRKIRVGDLDDLYKIQID